MFITCLNRFKIKKELNKIKNFCVNTSTIDIDITMM